MTVENVTIRAIAEACAREFKISHRDLIGKDQFQHFAFARQVVMYVAATRLEKSYRDIGYHLGGRHHSTILHGHRKIEAQLATDADLAERIERVVGTLSAPLEVTEEEPAPAAPPVEAELPPPSIPTRTSALCRAVESYLNARRRLVKDRFSAFEGPSIREEERAASALGVAYHDFMAARGGR